MVDQITTVVFLMEVATFLGIEILTGRPNFLIFFVICDSIHWVMVEHGASVGVDQGRICFYETRLHVVVRLSHS
jgi:hypothetical protein